MTVFFDLKDQVVLVTGGSKGIGRSLVLAFLKAGASVSVCARNQQGLDHLAQEQEIYSQHLLTISADVSNEKAVQATVKQTAERFGKIDILVNNVGGAIKFGNFWNLSAEDWRSAFELNVMSMVFFSREVVPFLRKSLAPRIINISSISGIEPGTYNPHYTTTKASTINFSKYLANILAPEKILVNCVCPGSITSDSWYKSIQQISLEKNLTYEEVEKELTMLENNKIPLGRMGEGEDISSIVLFLASRNANWITGSCFHINGGKMRAMT